MNPTEKLNELRHERIEVIARLRREDEARQAEAKRLGEDDPYGIYGESS